LGTGSNWRHKDGLKTATGTATPPDGFTVVFNPLSAFPASAERAATKNILCQKTRPLKIIKIHSFHP
jgi:hypothetical protein